MPINFDVLKIFPTARVPPTLLHTIDELTLALHAPDLYARIQAVVLSRGTTYEEAHGQVTGLSPSQVMKVFCELNGLPTEFFTVPLDWHQPKVWTAEQRLHGTVHLANAFAQNRLAPSSPETTLAYDDLVSKTSEALEIPQPVISTCLKTAWSTLLKRSPEMPLMRADPPDAEKARALLEEAASPQSVPAVQQLILELTQHVNEAPKLNTIISFVLEIMQRGLGFSHAFLIIPTPNGQELIARCGLGGRVTKPPSYLQARSTRSPHFWRSFYCDVVCSFCLATTSRRVRCLDRLLPRFAQPAWPWGLC